MEANNNNNNGDQAPVLAIDTGVAASAQAERQAELWSKLLEGIDIIQTLRPNQPRFNRLVTSGLKAAKIRFTNRILVGPGFKNSRVVQRRATHNQDAVINTVIVGRLAITLETRTRPTNNGHPDPKFYLGPQSLFYGDMPWFAQAYCQYLSNTLYADRVGVVTPTEEELVDHFGLFLRAFLMVLGLECGDVQMPAWIRTMSR